MTSAPEGAPARPRWIGWALKLLGVALLAFVVSQIGWHDEITLADGTTVEGTIEGPVPLATRPDAKVVIAPADGSPARTFALEALAQEEIGGDRYPKIREGLLRIVRASDKAMLLLGALMFGAIAQIGVWRWLLLLRSQGLRLTFWQAHKLTFIGFFFNNVVPSGTGGDLVKAIYVARGAAARKTPAVVTVIVDRVLGLVALALIALCALLTQLDNPAYREPSAFVFWFLGLVAAAMVVFFSRRVRHVLRIDALIDRLPFAAVLRKADEAIFAWRGHKGTLAVGLLLSFANQLAIQVMMWTIAAGLHVTTRTGGEVTAADYMVVLPVAFIVSSLPALPGGWGLREGVFALCFHFIGVDRNPAVALSVMNGIVQLAWSLLGGLYFVLGRAAGEFRAPAAAAQEAVAEASAPAS